MNFQDQNGYTALHKAVAHQKLVVIRELLNSRPGQKLMSDNVRFSWFSPAYERAQAWQTKTPSRPPY